MAGFKCPFCGEVMSTYDGTVKTWHLNFKTMNAINLIGVPHLEIAIYQCPNCNKEALFAAGVNGYIDNTGVPIFPRAFFQRFPDYVPTAILHDYEEAHMIMNDSPKAAATLARRCLQGMIHDFWNIHEKNLNAEITQLKGKVPASQWKAIDAVRNIGNIGAYMEHDVNLIIDVDPDEAGKLIRLIEHLIEKWYIDRHDAEALYAELADISDEKNKARKH